MTLLNVWSLAWLSLSSIVLTLSSQATSITIPDTSAPKYDLSPGRHVHLTRRTPIDRDWGVWAKNQKGALKGKYSMGRIPEKRASGSNMYAVLIEPNVRRPSLY